MIALLLSNIRLIGMASAVIVCFGFGWYVRGQIAENALEKALTTQEAKLTGQCNDDKKTTLEVNDDLQTKLSAINKRLAASKRLQPVCTPINSGVAVDSSGGGEHAGQNGISAEWLREYAAECEAYRTEVIILDNFGRAQ